MISIAYHPHWVTFEGSEDEPRENGILQSREEVPKPNGTFRPSRRDGADGWHRVAVTSTKDGCVRVRLPHPITQHTRGARAQADADFQHFLQRLQPGA